MCKSLSLSLLLSLPSIYLPPLERELNTSLISATVAEVYPQILCLLSIPHFHFHFHLHFSPQQNNKVKIVLFVPEFICHFKLFTNKSLALSPLSLPTFCLAVCTISQFHNFHIFSHPPKKCVFMQPKWTECIVMVRPIINVSGCLRCLWLVHAGKPQHSVNSSSPPAPLRLSTPFFNTYRPPPVSGI